jgi:NitT/TauT family transport system ATP-binding protein
MIKSKINGDQEDQSQHLCLRDLQYSFRPGGEAFPVLKDINLDVHPGEIVAIVGPSGCGKSTLVHLIAGFLQADSGRILLDGEKVSGPSTRQGIMFQDLGLLPWRTVRGNIQFGLESANLSKASLDERVAKLIESVGLFGFDDFYPYELSGGMAQRVALARTLAPAPRVLLMDEPFRSLDAQTRLMMQEELLRLWEIDRRTIVFVTHDVDEAVFLASRIIVLTARPATIKEIFAVPLPRPRTSAVRYRSDYLTIRNHVLSSVSEEAEIANWVNQHASKRPPDECWIGYVDSLAESLPLHVAQRRGFFRDQNLKVRLWPFRNGFKIAALVAEGHLHGASVGPYAFLYALDNGTEFGGVTASAKLATKDSR